MDILNQAKNLIEKSQNILILPSLPLQGDNLGSALALFFSLKKLGKNANILTETVPEKFQFLIDWQPDFYQPLHQNSREGKGFVVSVDALGKEISEMRYEKNENNLKIYLTLNKGELKEQDIKLNEQNALSQSPDLLIILGAKSLESLEKFFNQNPNLFYETPILNIDNQPLNENFGEVNLIEISSSSVAEILIDLIRILGPAEDTLLDENIATYLLTGIVWASQNFRHQRTRPKTLESSAFLIEKGGNHQKIIQHLYKQKSISQIRLLGRILEKLDFNEKKDLYSASLTKEDFQDCQAASRDLSFVVEELKFNFRYLPNLLILWESHASPILIRGILYSLKSGLIEKVLENFEGLSKGEGALFSIRDADLNSAKEKVLNIL